MESEKSETPVYTREDVLNAFKPFLQRGFTHPDDLPPDDPVYIEANRILDAWTAQQQAEAQRENTPEANLRYELSRSTMFTDAGFDDPDYLNEVANDWLVQDLEAAQQAGLTEIVNQIQAKIDEINSKLPEGNP